MPTKRRFPRDKPDLGHALFRFQRWLGEQARRLQPNSTLLLALIPLVLARLVGVGDRRVDDRGAQQSD